jgi:hypothetical protein
LLCREPCFLRAARLRGIEEDFPVEIRLSSAGDGVTFRSLGREERYCCCGGGGYGLRTLAAEGLVGAAAEFVGDDGGEAGA